ncbi:hypothetical protein BJY00DRAFT_283623 [Aspergillus carlsbadensis]|nr:hypothetical protein BJY00DRAFT_283623 [Aspergillus carlsbadensis]
MCYEEYILHKFRCGERKKEVKQQWFCDGLSSEECLRQNEEMTRCVGTTEKGECGECGTCKAQEEERKMWHEERRKKWMKEEAQRRRFENGDYRVLNDWEAENDEEYLRLQYEEMDGEYE